jgi:hypothetical protein
MREPTCKLANMHLRYSAAPELIQNNIQEEDQLGFLIIYYFAISGKTTATCACTTEVLSKTQIRGLISHLKNTLLFCALMSNVRNFICHAG